MTKEKKKKEKVIYYDDNSTIADMSNVGKKKKTSNQNGNYTYKKTKVSEREKIKTFFQTFKMMLIPTFIALLLRVL